MTNSKKILAVFTALLLVVFTSLSPSAEEAGGIKTLTITVESRGSGTATADKYEALGRYIDSVTFTAVPDGAEFDHWEIHGNFSHCDSVSDWGFRQPTTFKILPLSDIRVIAWFDDATPDEATPDEATSDEATPDEATSDEATPDEATPDESSYYRMNVEVFGPCFAEATPSVYDPSTNGVVCFIAYPDIHHYVKWEFEGDFDVFYGHGYTDPILYIRPKSDIYAKAYFMDRFATPDEATPDEATVDVATPDSATADQRSIKGKVKTYGSTADEVRVDIYEQGSEWTTFSSIAYDNEVEFDTESSLEPGKYLVKVSKKDHITREYNVTLADRSLAMDIELCPVGDITGDGKTNVQDCTSILRYVRQLDADVSDYQFKCGDVTGDNKVNVQDVTRILRHVRKIEELY